MMRELCRGVALPLPAMRSIATIEDRYFVIVLADDVILRMTGRVNAPPLQKSVTLRRTFHV